MNHFLDLASLERATLRGILDNAKARKTARKDASKGTPDKDAPLAGCLLAMLFEKPSTRTRVSFDVAMRQLGGQSLVLNQAEMQLGRGESLADTARVLSRYVDAVMVRMAADEGLRELASYADVPVINGLTSRSHPCQIVADILTFEEHCGAIEGQKIAWVGDGNNVAVSWIEAATILGFPLYMATPASLSPPQEVLEWAKDKGGAIHLSTDLASTLEGAKAVNTDCWVSMGDDNSKERTEQLRPFQITAEAMQATDDAIFMHCLPAYRGNEVSAEVIDGPRSVVFDEAENRLHAQKAILQWCCGDG